LNKEIDPKELGLILGILLSLVKSLGSNLKLEEVLGDKGPSNWLVWNFSSGGGSKCFSLRNTSK